MATYDQCGADIQEMVGQLLAEHHPQFADVEVTVACLYAYAPKNEATGEPRGPALKSGSGWPAAAKVKVNSLRDRVEGKADATILLDGDTWATRPENEQWAILDHELQHLELVCDEAGQVKTDDCGRPRLKLQTHDFEIGGFDAIVRRHKTGALEWKSYSDLNRHFTQKEFNWG